MASSRPRCRSIEANVALTWAVVCSSASSQQGSTSAALTNNYALEEGGDWVVRLETAEEWTETVADFSCGSDWVTATGWREGCGKSHFYGPGENPHFSWTSGEPIFLRDAYFQVAQCYHNQTF